MRCKKKNAEALAFYPKQVFEREAEKGRLFLGLLNGEPCGYLYVGSNNGGTLKCHQVCIQYDARRRLYGAALVTVMEDYAIHGNCTAVALRCGFDLDANSFWGGLGYSVVSIVDGGIRRSRKINVWRKAVKPELFETMSIDPAIGKTSAAVWARNKRTGIISQFARGNKLKQYRMMVDGIK